MTDLLIAVLVALAAYVTHYELSEATQTCFAKLRPWRLLLPRNSRVFRAIGRVHYFRVAMTTLCMNSILLFFGAWLFLKTQPGFMDWLVSADRVLSPDLLQGLKAGGGDLGSVVPAVLFLITVKGGPIFQTRSRTHAGKQHIQRDIAQKGDARRLAVLRRGRPQSRTTRIRRALMISQLVDLYYQRSFDRFFQSRREEAMAAFKKTMMEEFSCVDVVNAFNTKRVHGALGDVFYKVNQMDIGEMLGVLLAIDNWNPRSIRDHIRDTNKDCQRSEPRVLVDRLLRFSIRDTPEELKVVDESSKAMRCRTSISFNHGDRATLVHRETTCPAFVRDVRPIGSERFDVVFEFMSALPALVRTFGNGGP